MRQVQNESKKESVHRCLCSKVLAGMTPSRAQMLGARGQIGRAGCALRGRSRGAKSPGRQPACRYEKLAPALSRAPPRSLGPDGPAGRLTRRGYPAIGTGASSGFVGYWGRWRRVPASAGARHLKVRGHLHLPVLRRMDKPAEIDAGAPLAPRLPPA